MPGIYSEAVRVAQEFDLKIIPCGGDKAPCVAGWRGKATSDPDELAQLFTGAAELVGVPAGQENDLMVFDLDYREGNTPERNAKLQEFENEIRSAYPNGIRIHRTRNGGKHLIMLNPVGRTMPRNVMPKLELVYEGFQFIWPTEGSGYTVEVDVPLDQLDEPAARFTKVWEKMPGISSSGGLMSAEMADKVMRSDGEVGTRHEALLRLTQDFVSILKGRGDLAHMTDPQVATMFEGWFRKEYGPGIEPTRLEELMRWREQDGAVVGSDLGNALRRPLKDARREDRFAEMAAKQAAKMGKVQKTAEDLYREKLSGSRSLFDMAAPATGHVEEVSEGGVFVEFDADEDVKLEPWIIEHFVRQGDMGGITGLSGLGKTNLTALWIAGLLAGDGPAVGLPHIDRPHNVAWANPEEPREELHLRLKAALEEHGLTAIGKAHIAGYEQLEGRFSRFLIPAPDGGRGVAVNEELVEAWISELVKKGVSVMIIDPLTEFNDGDENSRNDRKLLNTAIRNIAKKVGMTVLYWAHTGKTPEGKRDDWYDGDLFAERGSSGGIAANRFGGTLTRVYPEGSKGDKARKWSDGAADPSDPTPNIVKLRITKAKLSTQKLTLFWEIRQSKGLYGTPGATMPVAHPLTSASATAMVQMHAAQNEDMEKLPMARSLVEIFGEGRVTGLKGIHDTVRAHPKKVTGWPDVKDLRPNEGAGKDLIKLWRKPVTLEVDDAVWTVGIIYNEHAKQNNEKVILTIEKA